MSGAYVGCATSRAFREVAPADTQGRCVERTLLSAAFDLGFDFDFNFGGCATSRAFREVASADTPSRCVERTLLPAAFDLGFGFNFDFGSTLF